MTPKDQPVAASTGALGAYFMGDISVAEALDKICGAALEAVPVATRAGISMTVDAQIGTYVFTHPDVEDVDRAQYATMDGPCVEAFLTGTPVVIPSTLEPGPFEEFCRTAAEHGLLSVLSTPLTAGAQVVGALNLYAPVEDAFDADAEETLRAFATHAAYLLLNHQAYWDARSLTENLVQALESRAQIEQAKGIIMGSTGASPEEAFEQLRAQSQQENVKLRDIAGEIVRTSRRQRGG